MFASLRCVDVFDFGDIRVLCVSGLVQENEEELSFSNTCCD